MPSAAAEDTQDVPGKIFIGGLALDIDEKQLENQFIKFGRITELLLKRTRFSEISRGYAFITYENPLDGEDAVKRMNGKILNGKEIRVDQAAKPSFVIEKELREKYKLKRQEMRPPPSKMSRLGPRSMSGRKIGGMDSRRGGRGGFERRGIGRGGMIKDSGRPRSSLIKEPVRRGSDSGYERGPPPRSGPPRSAPPQRSYDTDRGPPPRRGDDRFGGGMDRGGPPPRSRDRYSPSPPPRDYGGRGQIMDSRMPSRSASSRDYLQSSSRDYAPIRDYSPPPSRDYQSSRDFSSYDSRAPPPRQRDPPPRDSYSMSSRDYGGPPPGRSSFGGSGRDSMGMSSRDDYVSSRDTYREPPSRDYQSSRDFGSSRGPVRRDDHDRGPRDYDSFRDSGRSNGGPPSRSFGGLGSGRESSGLSRQTSRGPYESSSASLSRGPPSSSRGPPQSSRGPSMSSRGPMQSSRGPPPSSRGPPPSSRGPSQSSRGPPPSSRGPPPSSRGPTQSSRGPPPSSRGPPPSSRGPPLRDERGSGDSRRRSNSDIRGGPPAKRARPGGPPRGGGPPFRR